ncbi:MAG: glycosyltransferase family 4 protein [Patescibacteria group bacterium]
MKITIVSEFFPWSEHAELRGGVESRAFYFAKHLADKHQVEVITSYEEGTSHYSKIDKVTVLRVGRKRKYVQGGSLIKRIIFIWQAKRKIQTSHPDIIDGYNWVCHLAVWLARSKAKKVSTYHDVWVGSWIKNMGLISGILGDLMERYILKRQWDLLIANSKVTRNKLIRCGVKNSKIEVVYNGVELDKYNYQIEKFERPTVIYAGRLVSYKRVEDLIRAIFLAKPRIPNIQLKIIGSGPEEDKLKKLAAKMDKNGAVEFLGFVEKHADVIRNIKRSHIFSLPSAVEGFGIVTLEALASGVPYVNSNIAPTREITRQGMGGLLFECYDASDLALQIIKLLQNKTLYQRKLEEGRTLVQGLSWSSLAPRLEDVYQSIL